MTDNEKRATFRATYHAALRRYIENDPEYDWPDKSDAAIDRCIDKMLVSRSATLNANHALRLAAHTIGITRTEDLRAFLDRTA